MLLAINELSFAQCTDLFISEYVEGSDNNKAIELYNPTSATIDLSGYVLKRYSNGSGTASETRSLSGNIASGDVVVITNGQVDSFWVTSGNYWSYAVDSFLYSIADLHDTSAYPGVFYFNGDDAVTLEKTNNTIVDIFGKVGEDPGLAWTDNASGNFTDANGGSWLTKDATLKRKASVKSGIASNPIMFNATTEWDTLPKDMWDSLGCHKCDCITTPITCYPVSIDEITTKQHSVFIFPNPVKGNFFTVKAAAVISSIEIFNVIGQKILRKENNFSSGEIHVPVNNWHNGLYIVTVTFEDKSTANRKLFLQ